MEPEQLLAIFKKLELFDKTTLYKDAKKLKKKYDVENYTVSLKLDPQGYYYEEMGIDFDYKGNHNYVQVTFNYSLKTVIMIGATVDLFSDDYKYKEVNKIIDEMVSRNAGKLGYDEYCKNIPLYSIVDYVGK